MVGARVVVPGVWVRGHGACPGVARGMGPGPFLTVFKAVFSGIFLEFSEWRVQ